MQSICQTSYRLKFVVNESSLSSLGTSFKPLRSGCSCMFLRYVEFVYRALISQNRGINNLRFAPVQKAKFVSCRKSWQVWEIHKNRRFARSRTCAKPAKPGLLSKGKNGRSVRLWTFVSTGGHLARRQYFCRIPDEVLAGC